MYTMGHPDFIVCIFIENSIGLKRVKYLIFQRILHLLILRPFIYVMSPHT